jgi:hypothetical protein
MFEVPVWCRVDDLKGDRVLIRVRYASEAAYNANQPHVDIIDQNALPVSIVEPRFKYRLTSGVEVTTNENGAV